VTPSLNIEVEALDTPLRDFAELRRELIEQGLTFDEISIRAIPYSQLHLCCIGNAGAAACTPELVQSEKATRRERFLNMETDDFKEAETFLKIEQMYDDVLFAISNRMTLPYSTLTDCQKLWVRLTCLYNHVDNPIQRMQDVIALFQQCAANPHGKLPTDVCSVYAGKFKGLATVYPGRISDKIFREKVGEMAETVLQFMSDGERQFVEKEQLQDFSCTSDCFRILI
jgi:hypothetical protein